MQLVDRARRLGPLTRASLTAGLEHVAGLQPPVDPEAINAEVGTILRENLADTALAVILRVTASGSTGGLPAPLVFAAKERALRHMAVHAQTLAALNRA